MNPATGVWLSACDHGSCVEVCFDGDLVKIRQGTLGDASPVIVLSRGEYAEATAAILRGNHPENVDRVGGRRAWIGLNEAGILVALAFTADEWATYCARVVDGDLRPCTCNTPPAAPPAAATEFESHADQAWSIVELVEIIQEPQ